jgi:hypothetical protein
MLAVIARSEATKQSTLPLRGAMDCFACARNDGGKTRAKPTAVIAREGGRSGIPETPVMESRSRGVLDRPVKPDDDSF